MAASQRERPSTTTQLIDKGKVDGRKRFASVVRGRDGSSVDNDRATGVIDAILNDTLLQMREAFGPAPRRIERGMVARLPSWATWEKAFKRYKSGQKHLLKHGTITWGALVQANNQLFEPGERDHPGNVVYDRREFSSPTDLEATAQALAATKGSAQPDPAVDVIASCLAAETQRLFDVPVPAVVGGGDAVFTTVLFHREHLRGGAIYASVFPLLVAPEVPFSMVLPFPYWSDLFVRKFWFPQSAAPSHEATVSRARRR